MNFNNPITFLKFGTPLVIPPSPTSPVNFIKTTIKLIKFFKILCNLRAVDAIKYDCLIHNVFGKQFKHGK